MTGQTQTKVYEMDKKQMDHAYALQMLATLKDCDKYIGGPDMRNIARNAWELADEMKAQELVEQKPKSRGGLIGLKCQNGQIGIVSGQQAAPA